MENVLINFQHYFEGSISASDVGTLCASCTVLEFIAPVYRERHSFFSLQKKQNSTPKIVPHQIPSL